MRDSLVRVIDVIHYLKKEEKSITNYEHDVILQLINSAGEKVVYLWKNFIITTTLKDIIY